MAKNAIGGPSAPLCLSVSWGMHPSAVTTLAIHIRKLSTGQSTCIFLRRSISAGRLKISSESVFPFQTYYYKINFFASMMTWADGRLKVEQIKSHSFFYGADWNALRHIEPPFV